MICMWFYTSFRSPININSINIHYWSHHMISDVMCIWISSNLIFIAKVDNIYHQGSFLQLYKMRFHLWINLLRYYLPPNYLLEHLTLFLMVFLPRMKQKVKMNDRRWYRLRNRNYQNLQNIETVVQNILVKQNHL